MELKGIDEKVVEKVGEEGYFTRDKATQKKGEEAFFSQGEKPEVCCLTYVCRTGGFWEGRGWMMANWFYRRRKSALIGRTTRRLLIRLCWRVLKRNLI